MNSREISRGILRAIAIIVGVVLLGYFLYAIRSILLYIVIAAVVSLIGRPLMLFLTNKLKFKSGLAVGVCLVVFFVIFAGISLLFLPIITQQTKLLGQIDLETLPQQVQAILNSFTDYFNLDKFSIDSFIKQVDFSKIIPVDGIQNLVGGIFSGLGGFFIGLFSVVFIAFFALKDSHLLENSLLVFVRNEDETKIRRAFLKIKELLSSYFVGLLLQVLILFILYSILLLIFGVKSAIAVALIAALMNLIPYLGPLIGYCLVLLLTITGSLEMDFSTVILPKVIYVSIGYLVIQMIDNFINQPLIFGKSVKSHPLEIFLAILIIGSLLGIGGLIAAVPIYTAIKVISKEFLSEYKIVQSLTKEL